MTALAFYYTRKSELKHVPYLGTLDELAKLARVRVYGATTPSMPKDLSCLHLSQILYLFHLKFTLRQIIQLRPTVM